MSVLQFKCIFAFTYLALNLISQKYEFCLAIHEPLICSINGPHKPSKADISIFRGGEADQDKETWDRNSLYFKLGEGKKCVADSGYSGEPSKIVLVKGEHSKDFREFLSRVKNSHETFHTRLKSFNILGSCFRHGINTEHRLKLHQMAVYGVALIIQFDYLNGHPPFDA